MELKKALRLFRHWLWLIVLGAVVLGGITFIFFSNKPTIYRSSASFLIDSAPTGQNDEYRKLITAQTQAQDYVKLMTKRPVMDEVIAQLDLGFGSEDLINKVTVSADRDSKLVDIRVVDTDPVRASYIANKIGDVFRVTNDARQDARFTDSIVSMDEILVELDGGLETTQTKISEFGAAETPQEEVDLSRLNRQLNELQDSYNRTFESRQNLIIERDRTRNNFVLVEEAVEGMKIGPRVTLNTILATVLGGMIAFAAIFSVDFLDDTVKSPDDVTAATGLSTLAAVAYIKGEKQSDRLITHHNPRAPISEAFRVLRTNISYSSIDTNLKRILVTSSSQGEGKSTTSANLAVVMAQTGKRVIIVDADMRRPSQHKMFNMSNNQGLTTALLDSVTPITHHLQPTQVAGLRIMTSGPLPPNPAELLNSQRMSQVLDALNEEADLVLIDTPPVLTVADTTILSPRVDGCLLVIEMGKTQMEAVVRAKETIEKTGSTLFGTIINRSRPGRAGYYHYYYDYRYYTYEYGNGNPGKRNGFFNWITNIGKRA